MMANRPNPRRSNGSRRDAIRRRWRSIGAPCALCGKPIDYSLPAGHPMSFEVDEIVPVSKGGDFRHFGRTAVINSSQMDGFIPRGEPA